MTARSPLDVLPKKMPITAAEAKALRINAWSEKELQEHIITSARALGWKVYHTHDSRRSDPGYPDLHLVHTHARLSIFRELKTAKGRLTRAQIEWIDALRAAGVNAGVWRPESVIDGSVQQMLERGLNRRG